MEPGGVHAPVTVTARDWELTIRTMEITVRMPKFIVDLSDDDIERITAELKGELRKTRDVRRSALAGT